MLVVQDIFLTETAYLADVILPASAFPEKTGTFTNTDRIVQLGRQALDAPGEARQDLDIIIDIGRRLGLDLDLHASARGVRRDAPRDAVDRRHHLGAAGERKRGDLSLRARRRSGRARRVHRELPDRERPRASRAGRADSRRRAARPRLPVRVDHGTPARALAHRQHDPPHRSARRDRARARSARSIRRTSPTSAWRRAARSRSHRGAARSRCTRAQTAARRAEPCSSRSATTRRRPTC